MTDTLVCGGGVFGLTAALELAGRGHRVRLLDPGPLPHPLAASTDLSKAVRLEYGADEFYTALVEQALSGFRRWNQELGETLFHETGVLFAHRSALAPGGFEHDSLEVLARRGHVFERLGPGELTARFPAWNGAAYAGASFCPEGGWVDSGRLVTRLAEQVRAAGIDVVEGRLARVAETGGRVTGIVTAAGAELPAELVVVAAGSWTGHVLPWLAPAFRSSGMPVFHLRPRDPALFVAERFPVFGADISQTGYYGFPLHPREGVVKIANHGIGRQMHPEAAERQVTEGDLAQLRAHLAGSFPALTDAPVVHTRVCVYSDTWDGHFWIDRDPERAGLVVAAGGSGHAFKFAPLLGGWIADAAEGRAVERFRWRPELRPAGAQEAARCWHES